MTGRGDNWYVMLPVDMLQLLMLGQDIISKDPSMHGSMFVPLVLGSDKMSVFVATSQNKYYTLYL